MPAALVELSMCRVSIHLQISHLAVSSGAASESALQATVLQRTSHSQLSVTQTLWAAPQPCTQPLLLTQ